MVDTTSKLWRPISEMPESYFNSHQEFLGRFEHNVGGAVYVSMASAPIGPLKPYSYAWWRIQAQSISSPVVQTHRTVENSFILTHFIPLEDLAVPEGSYAS